MDSTPVVDVQTNACFEAAGAYFSGDWVYLNFGKESLVLSDLHIDHNAVLDVERWASRWAKKHVIIQSDSQAAVGIINKGSICNGFVMSWLCRLFWLSAIYNFRIIAHYIKGAHNLTANAISQMHITNFISRAFSFIDSCNPGFSAYLQPLLCHMPYASASFLSFRYLMVQSLALNMSRVTRLKGNSLLNLVY